MWIILGEYDTNIYDYNTFLDMWELQSSWLLNCPIFDKIVLS